MSKRYLIFACLAFCLTSGVAITQTHTVSSAEPVSYCDSHPDEAPSAQHPECYCETDDQTLPPGQGC